MSSLLQCQLSVEHELPDLSLLLAATHNFIYFSIKIMEDAEFELASSSNGLTRVLPPNTPDMSEEEGGGETRASASIISTVMEMEPQPRVEQVTGVRTLTINKYL